MLLRLFKQARIIQQGITGRGKQYAKKIPIGHIAVYTLAICSFHFLCWFVYQMNIKALIH
ncbi:hypothetical protein ANCDUO_00360 [Ancylostoma duodenale]|uniref:Uncharacterized protein n=1 Tax=Ancylostoma duodenale TaxID=51022 RepID=A0A0C2DH70_9BILA|nr:hypothetical protein ANCDUO_00360 [Ancylostoma duodenale]